MKLKLFIVCLAVLIVWGGLVDPTAGEAQEEEIININLGAHYSDSIGAEFLIFKKLGGGMFELGIMGDVGQEGMDRSIGVSTGVFLLERPTFDFGLMYGGEWTATENATYLTGSRGLYVAWRPDWGWAGRLYGRWTYDYPTSDGLSVSQDVAIEGTHQFGLGLSVPFYK